MGSQENEGEFSGPLPSDEVEVSYNGNSIEIELGSDISDGDMAAEACAGALCNQFGSYFAHQILGEEGLAALLVNTSPQGKPDDDSDDDPDSAYVGPDVDEDELIAQKTEFERLYSQIQGSVL